MTPEEQKQVDALHSELQRLRTDIASAETQSAQYAGRLVKALLLTRLDILQTTEALIQQRIHVIESHAPVTIQALSSQPDPERANALQEQIKERETTLRAAEAEAANYSGGLVHALAVLTAATHTQTLAMLQQQFMVAKFGLAAPPMPAPAPVSAPAMNVSILPTPMPQPSPDDSLQRSIIEVRLLRKRFTHEDYQEFVFVDLDYHATGLDKPARSIKGALVLADLFGESKLPISWTINKPMTPGDSAQENGIGFNFDHFTNSHQWACNTYLADMSAVFLVRNIIYQDGTRRDIE